MNGSVFYGGKEQGGVREENRGERETRLGGYNKRSYSPATDPTPLTNMQGASDSSKAPRLPTTAVLLSSFQQGTTF